jgi:Undecaprenyl-phosphate glucose phosphotransferase
MASLAEALTAGAAQAGAGHSGMAQPLGGARGAVGLWPQAVAASVRLADIVILLCVYLGLAAGVAPAGFLFAPLFWAAPWIAGPVFAALFLRGAGAYRFRANESVAGHAARVACGALAGMSAAAALAWATGGAPGAVLTAGVLASAALMLTHEAWRRAIRFLSRSGRFAHNIVIVGATKNAERLIETNARTGEVNVMAVFDDRVGRSPAAIGGAPVLGTLDDLFAWPDLPRADCIVVAISSLAAERTRELVARLRPLPNKVVLFLDLETSRPEATNLARIADLPVAYVSGQPDALSRVVVKRIEDIALASVAILVFAPVMALVALAVRLDSPGPVLFRQKRHGFNNRIIHVLKFRSMRADTQGPTQQVVEGDPRVTRVGRFIRKTSLDELPQFFNVLRGEMSMVGPRPHAIDMKTGEVESARLVADYAHRCRVKPGITGWAQIHGSRGPVHTVAEVEQRVRYDIDYIQRQSLLLDLWIVLRTVPCFLGDSLRTR